MSLQRYPKYKDSGVEWLGEVPEHWKIRALKHVVSIPITDGPHETPEFLDEGVQFASAESVSSGKLDFTKIRGFISTTDHERYSQKYKPQRNDIFMVKSGATTGVTAIVETDEDFNIWSPLAAIRCNSETSPRFVLNYLRSRNFLEAVTLGWNFGTQQNIGMGVIENLCLAAPSLEEQERIASFLTRETEKIDALVEEQRRLIELLKEKRQAVISHAVTKGLNPDASMKDSDIEWLGEVPQHWEVIRLKHLTEKIGSGKTPLGGSEVYVDDGVLFLRSQNVYDDGLRLDDAVFIAPEVDQSMENTRVKAGDVLLNVTGASIGRTCLVPTPFTPSNVNQHVCIIRISKIELRPFVSLVLKANIVKNQISLAQTGAARDGLNFDQIGNLEFAIPTELEESQAIVSFLDRETAKMDGLIAQATHAIDLLQERRTALISAAVTGKIDVRGLATTEAA